MGGKREKRTGAHPQNGMLHSSVRCDAVDVCGCSTSARSTAPCGGATPELTLIRGIIAHSTVFYEPAEMETLIRTRLSRPLVNMILYIPPSLPSSARPLVVFGAIVASNPNPAFVFILAALAPRSQSCSRSPSNTRADLHLQLPGPQLEP